MFYCCQSMRCRTQRKTDLATDDHDQDFYDFRLNAAVRRRLAALDSAKRGALIMTAHPYHAKLQRVLDRMGDLYTVNDILSEIAAERDAVVGRGRVVGHDPHRALSARQGGRGSRRRRQARRGAQFCTTGSSIFAAEVGAQRHSGLWSQRLDA